MTEAVNYGVVIQRFYDTCEKLGTIKSRMSKTPEILQVELKNLFTTLGELVQLLTKADSPNISKLKAALNMVLGDKNIDPENFKEYILPCLSLSEEVLQAVIIDNLYCRNTEILKLIIE